MNEGIKSFTDKQIELWIYQTNRKQKEEYIMTPQEKAREYAIEYAENKFPYDIGGDDSWNDKNALVEEVAETACLFMHEWDKKRFIKWAVEWLKHNIYDYFYWIEMEGESEANIKDTLYDNFKKYAEEQL